MGWTTAAGLQWPPVKSQTTPTVITGTYWAAYPWIIQLWKACHERAEALGIARWPRQYIQWSTGTIDSIVDNGDGTITIADADAGLDVPWLPTIEGTPTKRWTGWSSGEEYEPVNYDLIIETNGRKDLPAIIHVQISDNDATHLTVNTWVEWVTAGLIDNLNDVIGAEYHIVKRISGGSVQSPWTGVWFNERWPEFATDQEILIGTATGSGTMEVTIAEVPTTVSFMQFSEKWRHKDLAEKELLVWGNDGRLKRVEIIGNNYSKIWYLEQTWTPSGAFSVVAAADTGWPGRNRNGIFAWYGGTEELTWSHHANDNLLQAKNAAQTLQHLESFSPEVECELVTKDAFDLDVWSDVQNYCSPHEYNFSRWLYATLRGIQLFIEEKAGLWVLKPADEESSYDGQACIPLSTFAMLLHKAGVNSNTATVSGPDGSNNYYISFGSSSFDGLTVYWTVLDGCERPSGTGVISDGVINVGTSPTNDSYDGKTVVYTFGWTRYTPYMVHRMFYGAGTCFIPDADEEEEAIDPPALEAPEDPEDPWSSHGRGTWTKGAGVSEDYFEYDNEGKPEETEAFIDGKLARYIGDNFSDGTTGDTELAADTPYREHFYLGQRSRGNQRTWNRSKSGTITRGGKYFLTDSTKAWWESNWYHSATVDPQRPSKPTIRIEEGTATDGSSTTLEDTSKLVNPALLWWEPARFNGFTSPWAGFILEIDNNPNETFIADYKVPILSADHTTGTITFAAVSGLAVEEGDAWRIQEPAYHLNQWEGRQLIVYKPDGTTITTTIIHNDNDTLYFDELEDELTASWQYEIVEIETGGTYKWVAATPPATGGTWVKPTGEDGRVTPAATFRDNTRYNEPDNVKSYGKLKRGDYITIGLLTELYNVLNEMVWTKADPYWLWPAFSESIPPASVAVDGSSVTFSTTPTGVPSGLKGLDVNGERTMASGSGATIDADPPLFTIAEDGTATYFAWDTRSADNDAASGGASFTNGDFGASVTQIQTRFSEDHPENTGEVKNTLDYLSTSRPSAGFGASWENLTETTAGGTTGEDPVVADKAVGSTTNWFYGHQDPGGLNILGILFLGFADADPNPTGGKIYFHGDDVELDITAYDAGGWVHAAELADGSFVPSTYNQQVTIHHPDQTIFVMDIGRGKNQLHVDNIPTYLNSSVEFYAFATPSGTWDDNGDDVIENAWSLVGTDNTASSARHGDVVGDIGSSNYPATPDAPTFFVRSTAKGYQITGETCIVKWDVAGGMTYIAP